jgi:hypothetical protein
MRGELYLKSFQLNEKTKSFLSEYQLFEDDLIQQVQLQHRLELVAAFGIHKGMHVLEIGYFDVTIKIIVKNILNRQYLILYIQHHNQCLNNSALHIDFPGLHFNLAKTILTSYMLAFKSKLSFTDFFLNTFVSI